METRKIFTMTITILILTAISGFSSGCYYMGGVHGDGKVIKETRAVKDFNAIDVSGAFTVYLKQGDTEELIIEADENLMPLIRSEVRAGTLVIDTRKDIHHSSGLKVYITFKDMKQIELSGAVDIFTENRLKLNELDVEISGAADAKMELELKKLHLECSGASKLRLSGIASDVSADLSGACDIFAFELQTENFSLDLSGAGKAQVNVSKKIVAEISGAGSVRYKGSPSIIDQRVSGAGSIKHED